MLLRLLSGLLLVGLAGPALAQLPLPLPPPLVHGWPEPGNFVVTQVVDARPQTAGLGRVWRLGNPRQVVWEQGVPAAVQQFYNRYAPGRPGATPLLLRLRQLAVAETPHPTVSLVADFYTPWPDGSYHRLATTARRQVVQPAMYDATDDPHAANLGNALLGAFRQAGNRAAWLADSTRYPAAYVLAPAPHPADELPVLAADWVPRPGIYHTIEEFWLNAPSEPGRPEISAKPYHTLEWAGDSLVTLARRLPDGQLKAVPDAWGFSDGRRFFLRHRAEYHPLTRRGAGFVFYAAANDDDQLRRAVNGQALVQGLLLGAAASAASTPSLEKRLQFAFDPLLGTASTDNLALTPPAAALPTQLYLYRPRAAKGPTVRITLAGAGPPRELAAGDYLSFDVPAGQSVQLCTEAAGAAPYCLPLTPAASVTTYVEYRPGQAAPLLPQPPKTGMAALERLAR